MTSWEQPDRRYALINANNWPYISGEYINTQDFQAVDRSLIRNQLILDNSNPYRAVVDLVIDNIGEQAIGNSISYKKFLSTVTQNSAKLGQYVDVVKPGIVVAIDYRVENERTGQFLRSATAKLYSENKAFYVEANADDSAILVNFSDNMVKTITNRVFGADRMLVRLMKVKLYYVCLKRPQFNPYDDRRPQNFSEDDIFRPDMNWDRYNVKYHEANQPQYSFGPAQVKNKDQANIPSSWWAYNNYYHFEDNGRAIVFHMDRINAVTPSLEFSVPIGEIQLNKTFVVNTSFKILFKVSVWRNDVAVVNNTQKLASLLGVKGANDDDTNQKPPFKCPYYDDEETEKPEKPTRPPHHHHPDRPPHSETEHEKGQTEAINNINDNLVKIAKDLKKMKQKDKKQDIKLGKIKDKIKELHKDDEVVDPPEPPKPPDPPKPPKPHPPHHPPHNRPHGGHHEHHIDNLTYDEADEILNSLV